MSENKIQLNTIDLEDALFYAYYNMGEYLCREVGMPDSLERVDYLRYSKKNKCWYFYELKLTVADFNSKCAKTFRGNFNFFVVPENIYDKIKDNVDSHVGIIIVKNNISPTKNVASINMVKRAKKQDLQVDSEALMFSFMQALSRENNKYIYFGRKNNRFTEKELEQNCKYFKKMYEITEKNRYKENENFELKIHDLEEHIKDLKKEIELLKVRSC